MQTLRCPRALALCEKAAAKQTAEQSREELSGAMNTFFRKSMRYTAVMLALLALTLTLGTPKVIDSVAPSPIFFTEIARIAPRSAHKWCEPGKIAPSVFESSGWGKFQVLASLPAKCCCWVSFARSVVLIVFCQVRARLTEVCVGVPLARVYASFVLLTSVRVQTKNTKIEHCGKRCRKRCRPAVCGRRERFTCFFVFSLPSHSCLQQ